MFATGRMDSKASILFAESLYGWQVKKNSFKEVLGTNKFR